MQKYHRTICEAKAYILNTSTSAADIRKQLLKNANSLIENADSLDVHLALSQLHSLRIEYPASCLNEKNALWHPISKMVMAGKQIKTRIHEDSIKACNISKLQLIHKYP